MQKEDPRLLQRVTLREPRVYVGELLEMLQAKTGVALSASDRDGAASEQVAIFLNDIPLGDALEALWSLLSFQKAERIWRREGTAPNNYQYRFLRPASVGALASKLQKDIQKDFVAEADKFLDAVKLSPEELKTAAKRDPRFKHIAEDARARAGLQTLAEALSAQQRQDVLRGAGGVSIPVSQLPPSGKAFVGMARREMQSWNPTMTIGETQSIVIDQNRTGGKITPSLFIVVQPFGGYTYVGGTPFENRWRDVVGAQWLLPGDAAVDAVKEARTIPTPEKNPYDESYKRWKMGRRLAQLTDAEPSISLLARLPVRNLHGSESDIQSSYNRTLANVLSRFVDFGHPHKWRRDVLLIGCNNWFYAPNVEDTTVQSRRLSWSTVKRLRAEARSNGGFLTVETLFLAAANMSVSERERLALEEFPALNSIGRQQVQVQELMAYLGGARADYRTQIQSPAGLSIRRFPENLIKFLESLAAVNRITGPVASIRLEDKAIKKKGPTVLENEAPIRQMQFVFLGRSGEPLGPAFFISYPGRTPASTETKQALQKP